MGHNGAGSLAHLTCVFFFQLAGAEPTYVVYRGFGQTINDILSGSIDGTCELIASAREHVVGGSVRGFGVAAVERSPLLPDVPTSRKVAYRNSSSKVGWGSMRRRVCRRQFWPSPERRRGGACRPAGGQTLSRDRRQPAEASRPRRGPHAGHRQERCCPLGRRGGKGWRHRGGNPSRSASVAPCCAPGQPYPLSSPPRNARILSAISRARAPASSSPNAPVMGISASIGRPSG